MSMKTAIALIAIVMSGCATTSGVDHARLLVTVEASATEISPSAPITLTFRAENIGAVPIEIKDHVKRSGSITINSGAGEWGLMSQDYFFGRGGSVVLQTLKNFKLDPGQNVTFLSTVDIRDNAQSFRDGVYFADVIFLGQTNPRNIEIKVVPALLKLRHKP